MTLSTVHNGGCITGSVSATTMHTGPLTAGTVTLSGASSNGATLTSNGNGIITGSTVWTNPNANFHNGQGQAVMTIPHGENKVILEDKAELEVKGRVRINGEYLDERLERIETVLNIPSRNIEMENKYPKLKELWEAYNRELAKYKTWDKLKDSE